MPMCAHVARTLTLALCATICCSVNHFILMMLPAPQVRIAIEPRRSARHEKPWLRHAQRLKHGC